MRKSVVSFDGTKIVYDMSLDIPSLVFLHGAGGDLTAWKKEREFFTKKGIPTLAIDLRGHGLSGRPASASDYALEHFAKDVFAVLDKEKVKNCVIVGHCFGGIVAMVFHKHYPKLAKGYVFVDTTYKAPQKLKMLFKSKFLLHTVNRILEHENLKGVFSHVDFGKFVGTQDIDLRRIYSDIVHTSFKSWLFTYEHIAEFNGVGILKKIKQPVLIIEGKEDSIFPVFVAEEMKNMTKRATLNIIPHENHIIVINNPRVLEEEIWEFVKRVG